MAGSPGTVRLHDRAVREGAHQTAMGDAESALARRLGIGPTDLAATTHLTFAPEPIGPRELQRTAVHHPRGDDGAGRPAGAGRPPRAPSRTVDRRRVQLHASADTLAEVAGELGPLLRTLDGVASRLDDRDRAVVTAYLGEVLAAYEGFPRPDAR